MNLKINKMWKKKTWSNRSANWVKVGACIPRSLCCQPFRNNSVSCNCEKVSNSIKVRQFAIIRIFLHPKNNSFDLSENIKVVCCWKWWLYTLDHFNNDNFTEFICWLDINFGNLSSTAFITHFLQSNTAHRFKNKITLIV